MALRHDFHGIPRWARLLRTVWIVVLVTAVLTANGIFLDEIDLGIEPVWAGVAVAAVAALGLPQPVAAVLLWHLLQWATAKTRFHPPLRERAAVFYRRPRSGTMVMFGASAAITALVAWLVL